MAGQQATEADIRAAAGPLADAIGLDLVDVQVKGAGRRTLVRVMVDRKGGVDLAACEGLARDLSQRLDELEATGEADLPDGYRLEVTSPGIDHPLRDARAFDRVEGRPVRVLRNAGDGQVVEVDGTVKAAHDEAVVVDVEGEAVEIAYAEIVKATQRLPW